MIPAVSVYSGGVTQDRIFLLSIAEAEKYFPTTMSRMCKPTAYASMRGVGQPHETCHWWLRSPNYSAKASMVNNEGSIIGVSERAVTQTMGVRPVLWIRLAA